MLRTLTEKVDPRHCATLIVDVQNDFCAEGGAMHREGRDVKLVQKMVPRLARLVEGARAAKVKCVWIRNVYNTGPNWYLSEVWLEHAQRRRNGAYVSIPVCEPDAWNGAFYEIAPRPRSRRAGRRSRHGCGRRRDHARPENYVGARLQRVYAR